MTYVDEMHNWPSGRWCHLWADDVDELHAFAARIGLKRAWFQDKTLKHYDLKGEAMRNKAIAAGAVEGNLRAWARDYLTKKKETEK